MGSKSSKNIRTLDMYVRLCEGKVINKPEEAARFGVDERSIQRDIVDIRSFLDERRMGAPADGRRVEYDRSVKGFVMAGAEGSMMSNSEILAVSKILLGSRAFTKKEIDSILRKMMEGCVPLKNMKLVKELISNEQFHYVELRHKTDIQDRLWHIGTDIKEHRLIEIKYSRAGHMEETIMRTVEPVAILFSEYYFYLNAFIVEKNEEGRYVHKYDYPAVFRIDRIKAFRETGENFRVSYADRFEEGEFRKRVQFMYAGHLMKIQMKFYGEDPEPVLDRLPTARVMGQEGRQYFISAEVYGTGIVMWLLSQGGRGEGIRPESLRQEMKRKAEEILKLYS